MSRAKDTGADINAAMQAISEISLLAEGKAAGAEWLPDGARSVVLTNARRASELLLDSRRAAHDRIKDVKDIAQGGLRFLTDFGLTDSEPIVEPFLRLYKICENALIGVSHV